MIHKYPRTPHILGSRLQVGDEDLETVSFSALAGRHVVVEEKMDGANCALSFAPDGELRLQSRGHYLSGGPRERHFALLKQWANTFAGDFLDVLGDRYICYGEWLYAKHTIFYDGLPHYFMEFDVLDTLSGQFLYTPARAGLLAALPVVAVRVLFSGVLRDEAQLVGMLGASAFKTAQGHEHLRSAAAEQGLDPTEVERQTDLSPMMEGLYIKVEEDGIVQARYKYVRQDFTTRIVDSESHWLMRPIIPNQLRAGTDIFSPAGGGA
jgi:hypothetical protein